MFYRCKRYNLKIKFFLTRTFFNRRFLDTLRSLLLAVKYYSNFNKRTFFIYCCILYIFFTCTCNSSSFRSAALKYQWMKGSSFLLSVLNKHFFVSAGGNLYFSEVQTSDDANYHCVVTLAALPGDSMATSQPPTETSLSMALNVIGESKSVFTVVIKS